jgi:integrase
MTLYEAGTEYLNHLKVYGKSSSVKQAKFHMDKLQAHFGMLSLDLMGDRLVAEFIAARSDLGWNPSTINGSLRILKATMRYAGYKEFTVRFLKEVKRLPSVLSVPEVCEIQAMSDPDSDEGLAIRLALHTGLRHQEIMHLQVDDIDFLGAVLSVRAKPAVGWSPKNHEERKVPIKMGGDLEMALAARAARPVVRENQWFFPGPNPRYPRADVQPEVRRAFMRAHLYFDKDKPGLHMLRRTWASRMLENGVDINTVRELGGWSNLDVLLHYLRSSEESKRKAIDELW